MSGILVVGGTGLLGREILRLVSDAVAAPREALDLAAESVSLPPGDWRAVVNCAAYTAVERAEEEPDLAHRINARGPGLLADACRRAGARLIHISTDFVFDGELERPYREEDPPNPLGVYARTKRLGEERVLDAHPQSTIVRTAWLFGNGPCFPETIARRYSEGAHLRVVDDSRGSPTWTRDVARAVSRVLESDAAGILHAAGGETMSWRAFAERALLALTGERITVEGVSTDAYPSRVPRPRNSALDIGRARRIGWEPTPLDAALRVWASERPAPT